jgi:hypothetical protein
MTIIDLGSQFLIVLGASALFVVAFFLFSTQLRERNHSQSGPINNPTRALFSNIIESYASLTYNLLMPDPFGNQEIENRMLLGELLVEETQLACYLNDLDFQKVYPYERTDVWVYVMEEARGDFGKVLEVAHARLELIRQVCLKNNWFEGGL